eukprot:6247452-Heterocapsa_arctica.AAC.1
MHRASPCIQAPARVRRPQRLRQLRELLLRLVVMDWGRQRRVPGLKRAVVVVKALGSRKGHMPLLPLTQAPEDAPDPALGRGSELLCVLLAQPGRRRACTRVPAGATGRR